MSESKAALRAVKPITGGAPGQRAPPAGTGPCERPGCSGHASGAVNVKGSESAGLRARGGEGGPGHPRRAPESDLRQGLGIKRAAGQEATSWGSGTTTHYRKQGLRQTSHKDPERGPWCGPSPEVGGEQHMAFLTEMLPAPQTAGHRPGRPARPHEDLQKAGEGAEAPGVPAGGGEEGRVQRGTGLCRASGHRRSSSVTVSGVRLALCLGGGERACS